MNEENGTKGDIGYRIQDTGYGGGIGGRLAVGLIGK
jgi:hypothetical protein